MRKLHHSRGRDPEDFPLYVYIVVSMLTVGRTEEIRLLRWDHLDLDGDPYARSEIPPHIAVWCSVRSTSDTKTRKSRRTLALLGHAIDALRIQWERQDCQRLAAGDKWQKNGLVFTSAVGTQLDPENVCREFCKAIKGVDGIVPEEWTPRELRQSFVSILSDKGIPLEEISRLVGHSSTAVTEEVYRKRVRPVIQTGAITMDGIFDTGPK